MIKPAPETGGGLALHRVSSASTSVNRFMFHWTGSPRQMLPDWPQTELAKPDAFRVIKSDAAT